MVRCTRFVERVLEVRAPCTPRTDARAYQPSAQSESHAVVLPIHTWRAAVADCLLSARIRAFGQVKIITLLLCAGARGGDVRLQVPGREGEDPVPLRLGEMSRRDELMSDVRMKCACLHPSCIVAVVVYTRANTVNKYPYILYY